MKKSTEIFLTKKLSECSNALSFMVNYGVMSNKERMNLESKMFDLFDKEKDKK